jgi:hypothetical protein
MLCVLLNKEFRFAIAKLDRLQILDIDFLAE